jgi:hypothetical protein
MKLAENTIAGNELCEQGIAAEAISRTFECALEVCMRHMSASKLQYPLSEHIMRAVLLTALDAKSIPAHIGALVQAMAGQSPTNLLPCQTHTSAASVLCQARSSLAVCQAC